jgi:hypothetical protein
MYVKNTKERTDTDVMAFRTPTLAGRASLRARAALAQARPVD